MGALSGSHACGQVRVLPPPSSYFFCLLVLLPAGVRHRTFTVHLGPTQTSWNTGSELPACIGSNTIHGQSWRPPIMQQNNEVIGGQASWEASRGQPDLDLHHA